MNDSAERESLSLGLRWIVRSDLRHVLEIERESFEFPWSETDFFSCLHNRRDCVGRIVEHGEELVGYMIYQFGSRGYRMLNLAVHPQYRGRRIASQMIAHVIDKINHGTRSLIVSDVRESNLVALTCFRRACFRAIALLPSYYEQTEEDAIRMLYRRDWSVS